jgi:hypothetical protein
MSNNTNSNISAKFSNKQNINLLWDVLLDELNMKTNGNLLVNNVRAVFESNINPFIARINPNSNLMELNKLFLGQVVIAVNRLFPNLKQIQQMKKISISDEVLELEQEPYKVEDIQASRQSEFEKQMQQKRHEFESIALLQKPKELDFTDKNNDGKITEMQALIAETIAKRNFEVEQFQIINNTNLNSESETWLQPTNTSVKSEKQTANKSALLNSEQRKTKYINDLQGNNKKVTWDTETTTETDTDTPQLNNIELVVNEINNNYSNNVINNSSNNSNNIFNKLKKIPAIQQQQEQKQQSIEININQQVLDKISDLNTKFDTLIALMNQLVNKESV